MPLATHYQNLNIEESASQEAIQEAYLAQTLSWQPEGRGNRILTPAQQAVEDAFSVLSDPARRSEYDKWIATLRQRPINAVQIHAGGGSMSLTDRILLHNLQATPLTVVVHTQPLSLLLILSIVMLGALLDAMHVWPGMNPGTSWLDILLTLATFICVERILEGRNRFRRLLMAILACRAASLASLAATLPSPAGESTPISHAVLILYISFLLGATCYLLLLENRNWRPQRILFLPSIIGCGITSYYAITSIFMPFIWNSDLPPSLVHPIAHWLATTALDAAALVLTFRIFFTSRGDVLKTQVFWTIFTLLPCVAFLLR